MIDIDSLLEDWLKSQVQLCLTVFRTSLESGDPVGDALRFEEGVRLSIEARDLARPILTEKLKCPSK